MNIKDFLDSIPKYNPEDWEGLEGKEVVSENNYNDTLELRTRLKKHLIRFEAELKRMDKKQGDNHRPIGNYNKKL